MFGKAFLICPVGIFLLDVTTVPQHDFAQIAGRIRTVYLPGESVLTESGQVTRVVNVGMGQKDAINLGGGYRKGIPVLEAILFEPLKHPTIDEQSSFLGFQNKA
jgi:hypothetical protein